MEERDRRYRVDLLGFPEHGADEAARLIAQRFGVRSERAVRILGSVPWKVAAHLSRPNADGLARGLVELGARVRVRDEVAGVEWMLGPGLPRERAPRDRASGAADFVRLSPGDVPAPRVAPAATPAEDPLTPPPDPRRQAAQRRVELPPRDFISLDPGDVPSAPGLGSGPEPDLELVLDMAPGLPLEIPGLLDLDPGGVAGPDTTAQATSSAPRRCVSCRRLAPRSRTRADCPTCGWDAIRGVRLCTRCGGAISFGSPLRSRGVAIRVVIGLLGLASAGAGFFLYRVLGIFGAMVGLGVFAALAAALLAWKLASDGHRCERCGERADDRHLTPGEQAERSSRRLKTTMGAGALATAGLLLLLPLFSRPTMKHEGLAGTWSVRVPWTHRKSESFVRTVPSPVGALGARAEMRINDYADVAMFMFVVMTYPPEMTAVLREIGSGTKAKLPPEIREKLGAKLGLDGGFDGNIAELMMKGMMRQLNGRVERKQAVVFGGLEGYDVDFQATQAGRPIYGRLRLLESDGEVVLLVFAGPEPTAAGSADGAAFFDSLRNSAVLDPP